jgi:PEP-CTERM motif
MFTISVSLTFSPYSSYGLSYWLETPTALAPFLSITGVSYFTFLEPNQLTPNPATFDSTSGSMPGFMLEPRDLGASVQDLTPPNAVPAGTYHITDLTFMLAPGTPTGMYMLCSTKLSPRVSEVTDTDFNDNNIPPGCVTLNIDGVPEPSTLALLSLAAISSALLVYRRQKGQIR